MPARPCHSPSTTPAAIPGRPGRDLKRRSRSAKWHCTQTCFLASTMLAIAHSSPTAKMALPNTKTWGGMPTRVAAYTHTGNGTDEPLTELEGTKSSVDKANAIKAPASTPGTMLDSVILGKVTNP